MENWANEINEIKKHPRPIEYAITTIFKSIGKEIWLNDPIIKCIIASDDFQSNNIYQNHVKAACLMFSCFSLLKQEVHKGFEVHLLTLIFASLFHNMKHQGGKNKYGYENEKIAIENMHLFAEKNQFIKIWTKNHWYQLKNMPSWVNITDALEEIILVSAFLNVQEVKNAYLKNSEAIWRADLPLQINKIKQIFLEALLLTQVMPDHYLEFNQLMLAEMGYKVSKPVLKLQCKEFLNQFGLNIYISRASLKLGVDKEIESVILSIEKSIEKNK